MHSLRRLLPKRTTSQRVESTFPRYNRVLKKETVCRVRDNKPLLSLDSRCVAKEDISKHGYEALPSYTILQSLERAAGEW